MRIVVISDSHLSARAPECVANWHAAARAAARLDAGLAVHLGDITLDGQNAAGELAFASALVARWPMPMRCVPGNHDLGDGSGERPLDESLMAAYEAVFGPDRWMIEIAGWRVLGINAQLLGTGTAREAAQWRWLETEAAAFPDGVRSVLLLHRPVWRPNAVEQGRSGRYVADAARERLLGGPLARTLQMVVSGHTHQYMDLEADGVRHVWMPSSAYVLPDGMQARVGEKLVGIGLIELKGTAASFDLLCPDGMRRHDLSRLPAYSPG